MERSNKLEAQNKDINIEIRRFQNLLKVTSNGILVLGLWGILKGMLTSMSEEGSLFRVDGMGAVSGVIAGIVGYAVMIGIDLFFRYRVWRGARNEAEGRKKKGIYLIFAVIMLSIGILTWLGMVYLATKDMGGGARLIASLIVETTSIIITFELIYSAIKIRILRKKLLNEETGENS